MVLFSMNLNDNDLIAYFKVTPLFDAEYLRNGTGRHSFNEILTGTYIRSPQGCHFE